MNKSTLFLIIAGAIIATILLTYLVTALYISTLQQQALSQMYTIQLKSAK